MGLFRSLFGRKKARTEQIPLYSPKQTATMNQAIEMAMQGLKSPTAGFDAIAQDEMRRFRSDIIPSIAESFTAMGEGAQRSSAFQDALGRASADLGSSLAAQKAKYGLMREGLPQQLLGMGLTQQTNPIYFPSQPGVFRAAAPSFINSGLKLLGGLF
jgi:hypothetical protein